jgi:hypothetical protein
LGQFSKHKGHCRHHESLIGSRRTSLLIGNDLPLPTLFFQLGQFTVKGLNLLRRELKVGWNRRTAKSAAL